MKLYTSSTNTKPATIFSPFIETMDKKKTAFLLQDLQKNVTTYTSTPLKLCPSIIFFYSKNFDKNLIGRFCLDGCKNQKI